MPEENKTKMSTEMLKLTTQMQTNYKMNSIIKFNLGIFYFVFLLELGWRSSLKTTLRLPFVSNILDLTDLYFN